MKTKTVYRIYVDYEKEEKWLNEMAAQGWLLERFKIGRYVFCEGEPGAYMYRIELLDELPNHPKSKAYFEFLDELEIEVVDTSFRWIFLRKRTEDGPFHLYSDFDSMIRHERSILQLYSFVLFINPSCRVHQSPEFNDGLDYLAESRDCSNAFELRTYASSKNSNAEGTKRNFRTRIIRLFEHTVC